MQRNVAIDFKKISRYVMPFFANLVTLDYLMKAYGDSCRCK